MRHMHGWVSVFAQHIRIPHATLQDMRTSLETFLKAAAEMARDIAPGFHADPAGDGGGCPHSNLADALSTRLNALGNGRIYLVVDPDRDELKTGFAISCAITAKYRAITGDRDSIFWPSMEMVADDGAYFREPGCEQLRPMHKLPGEVFLIVPDPADAHLLAGFLAMDPARIRNCPLLPRETLARIGIYHEGFGHGTEPEDLLEGIEGHEIANREMRADIAAMAGILRDGASMESAGAFIALRDISALRMAALHPETAPIAALRMGGSPLEKGLQALAALPASAITCDSQMVEAIDCISTPLRLDANDFFRRLQTLSDAASLVKDDTRERMASCNLLAEGDPERLDRALAFLQSCMKGKDLFFRPAPSAPKPPAPRAMP